MSKIFVVCQISLEKVIFMVKILQIAWVILACVKSLSSPFSCSYNACAYTATELARSHKTKLYSLEGFCVGGLICDLSQL